MSSNCYRNATAGTGASSSADAWKAEGSVERVCTSTAAISSSRPVTGALFNAHNGPETPSHRQLDQNKGPLIRAKVHEELGVSQDIKSTVLLKFKWYSFHNLKVPLVLLFNHTFICFKLNSPNAIDAPINTACDIGREIPGPDYLWRRREYVIVQS